MQKQCHILRAVSSTAAVVAGTNADHACWTASAAIAAAGGTVDAAISIAAIVPLLLHGRT